MNIDLLILAKAVVAGLAKIFKILMTTHTGLRKKRAGDQAAIEKVISQGIKKYSDQSALGDYLRRLRERETIRIVKGLTLSPKEVPAFYRYMDEDHANERDLSLAWPHRVLSPEGTFDFILGPFDHLTLWTSLVQTLLYLLSAACAFLLAGLTPRLEHLQAAGFTGMAVFLVCCSALPMYLSRSVRAAKRIQYRRHRNH